MTFLNFEFRMSPRLTILTRMAVAVVLAAAAWMLVTWEQDPFREAWFPQAVPIEATHLPDGLVEVGQPGEVRVKLRASQEAWSHALASDFKASLDLSRLKPGIHAEDVRVETSGQYQVVDWEPRRVTVRLEPLAERTVPAALDVTGKLADGYTLLGHTFTPDQVTVSGPQNLVEAVTQAVVSVGLDGLREDVTEDLPPQLVDKDGRQISGLQVNPEKLRLALNVDRDVRVKTVPVRVAVKGQPAPGYELSSLLVTPSAVNIVGTPSVLSKVDFMDVAPLDLSGATADILRSGRLTGGDGYGPSAATDVTVRAVITPIRSTEVLPVGINVRGLGSGLDAKLSSTTAELTLDGLVPDLLALKPGDVSASVDLTGLTAGSHTVSIRLTSPSAIHIDQAKPSQVSVTLTPVAPASASASATSQPQPSGTPAASVSPTPAPRASPGT